MLAKNVLRAKLLLFFGDAVLVALAFLGGISLRSGLGAVFQARGIRLAGLVLLDVFILVGLYIFDLYNINLNFRSIRTPGLVLGACLLALTGSALLAAPRFIPSPGGRLIPGSRVCRGRRRPGTLRLCPDLPPDLAPQECAGRRLSSLRRHRQVPPRRTRPVPNRRVHGARPGRRRAGGGIRLRERPRSLRPPPFDPGYRHRRRRHLGPKPYP